MKQDDTDRLLREGIEAAKKGENEKALALLLEVVAGEEENETAWLWLSSVVKTDEERRICLENVLVLNPDSEPARRGLERLAAIERFGGEFNGGRGEIGGEQIIFQELKPISPASAVLYPERQVKAYRWTDPVKLQVLPELGLESHSQFDDVWNRESDICAFCAAELDGDDRRCPSCQRNLIASHYRYPRPSSDLTIYWVLLLGIAQLSLLLIILNLILRQSLVSTIWHGLLFVAAIILAIGIFLRQFWAYAASIVILLLSLTTLMLTLFFGPTMEDVVDSAIASGFFYSLADSPYVYILGPLEKLVSPLLILAVFLALLFGIFRVGPDFERVKVRYEARLDRGISDASRYFATGQEYARRGMWATATLHWQRAVAMDPTRIIYQRLLGQAYDRLGFYDRSLDVLKSAYRNVLDPETKLELEHMMADVRSRQGMAGAAETTGR